MKRYSLERKSVLADFAHAFRPMGIHWPTLTDVISAGLERVWEVERAMTMYWSKRMYP